MRNPSILLLQQGQLLETVAHFRALARKVKTRRPPDAEAVDELNDVLFMFETESGSHHVEAKRRAFLWMDGNCITMTTDAIGPFSISGQVAECPKLGAHVVIGAAGGLKQDEWFFFTGRVSKLRPEEHWVSIALGEPCHQ